MENLTHIHKECIEIIVIGELFINVFAIMLCSALLLSYTLIFGSSVFTAIDDFIKKILQVR